MFFSQADFSLEREILDDQLAGRVAIINDLETLHQVARRGNSSPLAVIEQKQLQIFIESAVFSEFGLASFDGSVLEGLGLSDAYRFLQLFGWEQYTLSFIDALNVTTRLDQELMSKLEEDVMSICPPYEPQGGAIDSDTVASKDGAIQCYDPQCVIRNSTCRCTYWGGGYCNICRC